MENPRGYLSTVRLEMMAKAKSITTLRILMHFFKKEQQKIIEEFQLSGDMWRASL